MNEILIKLGIGTLGAIIGFFIFRKLGQNGVSSEQNALETETRRIAEKISELDKDRQTQESASSEKIKAIEDEQNKEVTKSNIVDFFNNRKP